MVIYDGLNWKNQQEIEGQILPFDTSENNYQELIPDSLSFMDKGKKQDLPLDSLDSFNFFK